ncbi:hypothetical protein [Actinomadura sp. 9N407]
MVLAHPWSELLQGAEEYLRHCVQRPGVHPDAKHRLQAILEK